MVKQQPKRRGRRSHTAKCEFCGKENGDGSPWWNKSKDGWSITFKKDDKSRNSLLTKGWNSHDEAIRLWKEMSLGQVSAGPVVLDSYSSGEDVTVQWLVNHRLDYLKANSSDSHYKNSKNLLKQFCENGFKDVTISELREDGIASIKQWVALRSWNDTTKDYFYRCLKAMFNFATGNSEDGLGVIESSRIAKLNTGQNRVRGKARLTLFSAEQEKVLLTNTEPRGIHPQLSLAFRVANLPLRPAQHLNGINVASLLAGGAAPDRQTFYWHYPHYHGSTWAPGGAVRNGDWKLIEFFEENTVELYDVKADIGERTSLAAQNPERVKSLRAELATWRSATGAVMPRPNPSAGQESGKNAKKAKKRSAKE